MATALVNQKAQGQKVQGKGQLSIARPAFLFEEMN